MAVKSVGFSVSEGKRVFHFMASLSELAFLGIEDGVLPIGISQITMKAWMLLRNTSIGR
jgi:hypothetical protein